MNYLLCATSCSRVRRVCTFLPVRVPFAAAAIELLRSSECRGNVAESARRLFAVSPNCGSRERRRVEIANESEGERGRQDSQNCNYVRRAKAVERSALTDRSRPVARRRI